LLTAEWSCCCCCCWVHCGEVAVYSGVCCLHWSTVRHRAESDQHPPDAVTASEHHDSW